MSFGLTSSGFNIKRLEDIKNEIEERQREVFPGIDQSGESANGQQIGVYSKPAADMWEGLQNIYFALSPSTAEDVALDNCVEFNGIKRLNATPTTVDVGIKGTLDAIVPSGTLFKNTNTEELFKVNSDTKITNISQRLGYVEIVTVADSTSYTISLNAINHTISSGVGATADTIATALAASINTTSVLATALKLDDGIVRVAVISAAVDIGYDSNMDYWTACNCSSVNKGKILAAVGTIDDIETPVPDLDEVYNFDVGRLGRDKESDYELRTRRLLEFQKAGAGTLPSIVSRIRNDIEDVTSVKGFENREDVTVGVLPPHSIHIIVEAPNNTDKDQEIGELLWIVKPGGIQTYGSTSVNVIDSNGDTQIMKFTRPTSKAVWVRATITKYSEELYPTNGDDLIKDAIVEYGNTFESGLDVIPQRFLPLIYANVSGIELVAIELSFDGTTYVTTKLDISDSEIATFDASRVTVNS